MYWPVGSSQVYVASVAPRVVLDRRRNSSGDEPEEEEDGPEANKAEFLSSTKAAASSESAPIVDICAARQGHLFVTIDRDSLTIWRTDPVISLACIIRSQRSLESYGENTAVLLRPDATVVVIQTSAGYLVTYAVVTDPTVRVYQQVPMEESSITDDGEALSEQEWLYREQARLGFAKVTLRFRMVIKVDAGIIRTLALEDELIVATARPPAMQCIRWQRRPQGGQTRTELISRMDWIRDKAAILDAIHDRAMSLAVWIMQDGCAYAVQNDAKAGKTDEHSTKDGSTSRPLFRGSLFHEPFDQGQRATRAAINPRFSLLAISREDRQTVIYSAKDYKGNIPFSHTLECLEPADSTGQITALAYSPDGHCLFVGFEKGWIMWSVHGKRLATSFDTDRSVSEKNDEGWLLGVQQVFWLNHGASVIFSRKGDCCLYGIDMVKSSCADFLSPGNVSRTTLLAEDAFLIYDGYDMPQADDISVSQRFWHRIEYPTVYIAHQRPLRLSSTSSDGKYFALAGRRGFAHVDMSGGRWRTFQDPVEEESVTVRGGMCWYHDYLIVALEIQDHHELRMYARSTPLEQASACSINDLPAAVVTMLITGQGSLLVYTFQNEVLHFAIEADEDGTSRHLVFLMNISLSGIVRAPARVRALTWIVPFEQLRRCDPLEDARWATIICLVDARLVALRPVVQADNSLRHHMQVIANGVEYFDLTRDRGPDALRWCPLGPDSDAELLIPLSSQEISLSDSLWYFDGITMMGWLDVAVLMSALGNSKDSRNIPPAVKVECQFYPTSVSLKRGIVMGIESNAVLAKESRFSFFQHSVQSQLFLPPVWHHLLCHDSIDGNDSTSTAHFTLHTYRYLGYLAHALEMLLHIAFEDEIDQPPISIELSPLRRVLAFISQQKNYLDIIVRCVRKTDAIHWPILFQYLPAPRELFESAMNQGRLQTASAYLVVLQTLQGSDDVVEQCIDLLNRAQKRSNWQLCMEVVTFLHSLDKSGINLRRAIKAMAEAHPTQWASISQHDSPDIANLIRSDHTNSHEHKSDSESNKRVESDTMKDLASIATLAIDSKP